MQKEQFHILLHFFEVLADVSRLKIVSILAKHECSLEKRIETRYLQDTGFLRPLLRGEYI
jgi:hypothetical protein